MRGLALHGVNEGIVVDQTVVGGELHGEIVVEENVIGTSATSFSDLGTGSRFEHVIRLEGENGIEVRENLLGYTRNELIDVREPDHADIRIHRNQLVSPGTSEPANGIQLHTGVITNQGNINLLIEDNYIEDAPDADQDGDLISIDPTPGSTILLRNNTIEGNNVGGTNGGISIGLVPQSNLSPQDATTNIVERNLVQGTGDLSVAIAIDVHSRSDQYLFRDNVIRNNQGNAGLQINIINNTNDTVVIAERNEIFNQNAGSGINVYGEREEDTDPLGGC